MRLWGALLLAAGLLAQEDSRAGPVPDREPEAWARQDARLVGGRVPIGILRGDLQSWRGTPASGEFTLRTPEGNLYRCTYNDKTYFERDRLRIAVTSLRAGDELDIVSDHGDGSRCYARTVHVVVNPPPSRLSPERLARLRARRLAIDSIIPRGNLTFTGIVSRLSPERLELRTRSDGHKTFLLRDDTGYSSGGAFVDASHLSANTRVFIRAGRNFEGDLEAYHVIWGDIFSPR